MTFKVAICDDEKHSVELLQKYLEKVGAELDIDFEISCFTSSISLLTSYTTYGAFHIVFLDIEMAAPNGIETAKRIRSIPDRDVRIVFVSNYPEYMKESFNVQAFQYLSKPYSYSEFKSIILQLSKDYEESLTSCLLLKTDYAEQLVHTKDIISIETTNAKKKLLEVTLTNEAISILGSISDFEKDYGDAGFISPSRGCLVNIQHIHLIKQNELLMSNGKTIPLSRRKEKAIKELFNKKLLVMKMKR